MYSHNLWYLSCSSTTHPPATTHDHTCTHAHLAPPREPEGSGIFQHCWPSCVVIVTTLRISPIERHYNNSQPRQKPLTSCFLLRPVTPAPSIPPLLFVSLFLSSLHFHMFFHDLLRQLALSKLHLSLCTSILTPSLMINKNKTLGPL